MTTLSPELSAALKQAEEAVAVTPAEITAPSDRNFDLAAGYLDENGGWHTTFQVRELTGRDEEAMGKTKKVGALISELIQRGLVSVGPYPASEVINGLVGGDWDTVLLAVRAVTFGDTVDYRVVCRDCRSSYEVTINLLDDVPVVRLEGPEDLSFTYKGRHGDEYEVYLPTGGTQRKVLQNLELSISEQNTILLKDCVTKINGRPALPEQVMDMPLADRRKILAKVADSRPGPRLEEVKTLCPNCGAENGMSLNIAALFQ